MLIETIWPLCTYAFFEDQPFCTPSIIENKTIVFAVQRKFKMLSLTRRFSFQSLCFRETLSKIYHYLVREFLSDFCFSSVFILLSGWGELSFKLVLEY